MPQDRSRESDRGIAIVCFWRSSRDRYLSSREALRPFLTHLLIATGLTGLIGLTPIQFIERVVLGVTPESCRRSASRSGAFRDLALCPISRLGRVQVFNCGSNRPSIAVHPASANNVVPVT